MVHMNSCKHTYIHKLKKKKTNNNLKLPVGNCLTKFSLMLNTLKQTVTYKAAKKVWDLLSYTVTADHNRDEDWGSLKILRGLNQILFFTFSKEVSFRLCEEPSISRGQEQTAAMKE